MADVFAYEATGPGDEFGMIDLTTGLFTPLSNMGLRLAGLGSYGGVIYGGAYHGNTLYNVNTSTGALTAIGTGNIGNNYLLFGSTTMGLYGIGWDDVLYSINPASGAATQIGWTGIPTGTVMGMSAGGNTLYVTTNNSLYALDTTNGSATLIASTTEGEIGFGALVSIGGVLYGGAYNGASTPDIYSLDPQTGAATFVAASPSTPDAGGVAGFYGLEPVVPPVPSVVSISATTDNGATDVNSGHIVTISLNLSDSVYITGNPFLLLNDNEIATYAAASGSSTLTFTYTVQQGDNIPDLQVTGLNLNGGAIQDSAGNALSGLVQGDLALQIDTTAPTVAVSIDNTTLNLAHNTATVTFTFSEAPTDFSLNDVTSADGSLSNLSGSGMTHTATFTANAGVDDNAATVSVINGSYHDAAGNAGTGASTMSPVKFSSAVATFYEVENNWAPSQMIDGIFTGPPGPGAYAGINGWSVYNYATDVSEGADALLTLASPLAAGQHTLTFKLYSNYYGNPGHVLGDFALAYTTAASPTLSSPQTPVSIQSASSLNGTTFSLLSPGELLANISQNSIGKDDTYTISASIDSLAPITGIFLDAIKNPALPGGGPGAFDNGNFVVSEFTLDASSTGGSTVPFSVDTVTPTVVVSIDNTDVNVANPTALVTFVFSEAPTSFALADTSAVGGTLSNLQQVNATTYTATFTGAADTDITNASVSVTAGSWQEGNGNAGAGGSTASFTVDTVTPTVAVSINHTDVNVADPTGLVTFTFSKAPTDFSLNDVTSVDGSVSNLSGSGTTYTATFTANAGVDDNAATVSVINGSYHDAAGNAGTGASTMSPVKFSSAVATFYEVENNWAPSQMIDGIFTGPPGPGAYAGINGWSVYNYATDVSEGADALLTLASPLAAGQHTLTFKLYSNYYGNPGHVLGDFALAYTTAAASPTLSSPQTPVSIQSASSLNGTTFSLLSPGELLANISQNSIGKDDTYTISASIDSLAPITGIFLDAIKNPALPGGGPGAFDNGNFVVSEFTLDASSTGGSTVPFSVDTVTPTVVVSIDNTDVNVANPTATVTFAFSEAPTSFALADTSAVGGTLSNLQQVNATTYTATFTGAADTDITNASVSVTAGSWQEGNGNAGAGGSTASFTVDTVTPTVAVSINHTDVNVADPTGLVTFTFSKAPTDFSLNDVTSVDGSVSNLSGSGTTYTATFTANAGVDDNAATVSVINGSYHDAAGNAGTGASTMSPVKFSSAVATFYEVENNWAPSQMIDGIFTGPPGPGAYAGINGWSVYNYATDVSEGADALLTLASPLAAGQHTLTFKLYSNYYGNPGHVLGDFALAYTTAAASPTLSSPQTPVSIQSASSLNGTTFSLLSPGELLANISQNSIGKDDTYTISASIDSLAPITGIFLDAIKNPALPGGGPGAFDNGNFVVSEFTLDASSTGGSTVPFSVDTVTPTVVVSIDNTDVNVANPTATVTFAFSEAPTSFALADTSAVGGTLSNLQQVNATTYTATFTGAADTDITNASVSVTAGSWQEGNGNAGAGGSTASFTVDTVTPTVAVSINHTDVNVADPTGLVTFTFSKAPTDFSLNDVTSVDGSVSNLSGSGTTYTATFTANAGVDDNAATVSVINGSYHDAAGNAGTGASTMSPVKFSSAVATFYEVENNWAPSQMIDGIFTGPNGGINGWSVYNYATGRVGRRRRSINACEPSRCGPAHADFHNLSKLLRQSWSHTGRFRARLHNGGIADIVQPANAGFGSESIFA